VLVSDGFGVGVAVGVAVGVDVGVAVGVAVITLTPLFQTNFFPLFTHVNFNPFAVAVTPALVHVAPALGAAEKLGWVKLMSAREITVTAKVFCRARIRKW